MTDLLRQWAGGICAGCMLAGAVQVLLPASRHTAVIKNIAVLYIVLAILSPAKNGVKLNSFIEKDVLAPQVLLDASAMQERYTEDVLAKSFTDQLAAAGLQAQVQVTWTPSDTGMETLAVQAVAPTDAQSRAAELLLREWIGEGGTVECQTKQAE